MIEVQSNFSVECDHFIENVALILFFMERMIAFQSLEPKNTCA